MAALDDLASKLFGSKRAESNIVSTDATTRTYVGTATSASEDGSVYVALSQDVTLPDDDDGEHGIGVEMPTTVGVSEGDEVIVTLMGGGTMKSPVVTGNPGWGDNVQAQVDNAETLAEQAEAVASATGQNFWPDTDGVHVTQVTKDEWNDSTSPNYHSGANVLLNALGQLFRDGVNNLLGMIVAPNRTFTGVTNTTSPNVYLNEKAAGILSVEVDGTATSNYMTGVDSSGNTVVVLNDWKQGLGPYSIEVGYVGQPAVMVFDGTSPGETNPVADFTANRVSLMTDMLKFWTGGTWTLGTGGIVSSPNVLLLTAGESNTPETPWANYEASIGLFRKTDGGSNPNVVVTAGDKSNNGTISVTTGGFNLSDGFSANGSATMGEVVGTIDQRWRNLGSAGSGGRTFTLPHAGTWLLVTGHNSVAGSNSIWILRTGGNNAFKMSGGSSITVSLSGTSLTVKSSSGTVGVYASYIG